MTYIQKQTMFYGANPAKMRAASRLRKNMTLGEVLLWKQLRNRNIFKAKFRKQHPINIYIADFYCHEHKLVIEVDGEKHDDKEQIEYDQNRTDDLNNFGLKVIRFTNFQIINNINEVINHILRVITDETPLQGGRGAIQD
jgi:very-short-patch-repair endonuclease